jgi:hypothetical protein
MAHLYVCNLKKIAVFEERANIPRWDFILRTSYPTALGERVKMTSIVELAKN